MRTKAEMLDELRGMLEDVLLARTKGATYPRLSRAHGFLDGYMRALLDSGAVTQGELLELVAEGRAKVHGPSVLETSLDVDAA
jgi:hypothetical protein